MKFQAPLAFGSLLSNPLAPEPPVPRDPLTSFPPTCIEFPIPVHVSATNFALPAYNRTDIPIPAGYFESLPLNPPNQTVEGNFEIYARYCAPTRHVASRTSTLQFLVHGITYTRDYWFGFPLYRGGVYSYAAYAADAGYPTLSIDRLCNGLSSHPDPIEACQAGLQVEVLNELIKMAKDGRLHHKIQKFKEVVYVGHSYGSFLGDALAYSHPNAAAALILTGFSNLNVTASIASLFTVDNLISAQGYDPARFGQLPPAYLVGASPDGRRRLFYSEPGRDFDPHVYTLDFSSQGTVAVGEFASLANVRNLVVPNYKGPVLVVTGANDGLLCGAEPGLGFCGYGSDSVLADTANLFPNAARYDFFQPNRTGHDLNFHFSSIESFNAMNGWLGEVGF